MKPGVFVSHANQDKDVVQKLCTDLQDAGVDTWVSFRDIPPGVEWNKAIERAMQDATHVVVVASQASIASDYVRAEVEWALANGKTVIPALVEQVSLPLRWHTLQYVDLASEVTKSQAVSLLAAQLPKNTQAQLASLLEGDDVLKVRQFIWERPYLVATSRAKLVITRKSLDECLSVPFRLNDPISFERADILRTFFATESFLTAMYLLDHRKHPFNQDGTYGPELCAAVDDFCKALQASVDSGWELIGFKLMIFAGQRQHYDDKIVEWRQKAASDITARAQETRHYVGAEFSSYTKLLEQPEN